MTAEIFDPFNCPFIRPEWHDRIIMTPAPATSRVYGVEMSGGPCCLWTGWHNGSKDPHGKVKIDGVAWFIHRWAFACHHDVMLSSSDIVDHICRRRLCFNPYHHDCVTPLENFIRGDGPLYRFKSNREYKAVGDLFLDPEDVPF